MQKCVYVDSTDAFDLPMLLLQVRQNWSESEATSTFRVTGQQWSQSYLALDGTDADPHSVLCDPVTLYTGR